MGRAGADSGAAVLAACDEARSLVEAEERRGFLRAAQAAATA